MSKLPDDIQALVDDGLKEIAEELETAMKNTVNVRTGALRDSIDMEKVEDGYEVGVNIDTLKGDSRNKSGYDYSKPYYYGHGSWGGHKFLEIAMNAVGSK